MDLSKINESTYLLKWDKDGGLNLEFVAAMNERLDSVLQDQDARCLVTTGSDKIYSNGLDLRTILSPACAIPPHVFLTQHYFPLLSRILTLPLLTIAAVQGHAYAGGMVLALAHDCILMRQDRGYMCMNEVLLPATIPPGMAEIVKGRLQDWALRRDCMLHARRFDAGELVKIGVVDRACSLDEMMHNAVELAQTKCTSLRNRSAVGSIKEKLHAAALQALTIPEPAETFSMPGAASKL